MGFIANHSGKIAQGPKLIYCKLYILGLDFRSLTLKPVNSSNDNLEPCCKLLVVSIVGIRAAVKKKK